jgi:hypothetical protein
MSHVASHVTDTERYARCVEVSKRIRWDIEHDVFRGRGFDFGRKFLPDGLTKVNRLPFLAPAERRLLSQVQGRTYANVFCLFERFIGAKMLEISSARWAGDQIALEALVRFTDEELKHQEMFRRLESMAAAGMPHGYTFLPQPNDVARAVLATSGWAVLALTCNIELFTHTHYRYSIDPDHQLDTLWKDVFAFHWKEESQHAILDEMEWLREDSNLDPRQRDRAVDDLVGLLLAIDRILQTQAGCDAEYFMRLAGRAFDAIHAESIHSTILAAYRWQFITSGVMEPRFLELLGKMINAPQGVRISAALAPITGGSLN